MSEYYNKTLPWEEGVFYVNPSAWDKAVDDAINTILKNHGFIIPLEAEDCIDMVKIDGVYKLPDSEELYSTLLEIQKT